MSLVRLCPAPGSILQAESQFTQLPSFYRFVYIWKKHKWTKIAQELPGIWGYEGNLHQWPIPTLCINLLLKLFVLRTCSLDPSPMSKPWKIPRLVKAQKRQWGQKIWQRCRLEKETDGIVGSSYLKLWPKETSAARSKFQHIRFALCWSKITVTNSILKLNSSKAQQPV